MNSCTGMYLLVRHVQFKLKAPVTNTIYDSKQNLQKSLSCSKWRPECLLLCDWLKIGIAIKYHTHLIADGLF